MIQERSHQAIPEDATLAQERQRKETLRQVFITSTEVIKRYTIRSWHPFYDKPWKKERKAMIKAQVTDRVARHITTQQQQLTFNTRIVTQKKSYLAGQPVINITSNDIQPIADLLADLHQHGVVTHDCQKENFLMGTNGKLHCIDLGKASTYHYQSPLFLYAVGSEIAKLMHRVFDDNDQLMNAFYPQYLKLMNFNTVQERIVQLAYQYCRSQRIKRQKSKKRSGVKS